MKKILLSFDVEEFDLPREHGMEISLDGGIKVSAEGLEKILDLCKECEVKATFFCTGNFALKRSDLIKRIAKDGHEVACHGVDHFNPKSTDIKGSKKIIEKVVGMRVYGYRQPRMSSIDYKELVRCGYKYDSSVNPAFIPGRYNHLNMPKTPFMREDVLEIPTSVVTFVRVPLFWLALHLLPMKMYIRMARIAIRKTGYFATYFHPWEFANLSNFAVIPKYIRHNSGDKLVRRLSFLIGELKKCGSEFATYKEFAEQYIVGIKK